MFTFLPLFAGAPNAAPTTGALIVADSIDAAAAIARQRSPAATLAGLAQVYPAPAAPSPAA